jgi:predicted dehydrogenase
MTTRVGLHGAGMIAFAHAAAARTLGYELAAVASRTPERAERVASMFAAPATTYSELAAMPPMVVVVATPPQCHAADVLDLLGRGHTVLVEKPLCRTLDEADRIVEATQQHGGRLLYGENLAAAPVVQQMVRLAARVGRPTHLEVRSLQGLPTWGAFTTDEWGGGALFDLGVHPLAVAMLLASAAGEGRVTGVAATLRGADGHGSDEHADVTLHFASGFTARVESSWQHGPEPQWDAQLAGDAGVVRAELLPATTLEFNGDEVALPQSSSTPPALADLGYLGQLQTLVRDSAAALEPAMSAAFGREVLQVVMAAYASAGAGSEVVALPFTGPRDLTPLQVWRGA